MGNITESLGNNFDRNTLKSDAFLNNSKNLQSTKNQFVN